MILQKTALGLLVGLSLSVQCMADGLPTEMVDISAQSEVVELPTELADVSAQSGVVELPTDVADIIAQSNIEEPLMDFAGIPDLQALSNEDSLLVGNLANADSSNLLKSKSKKALK